jgi:Protein of unknown function (DUF2380)
MNFVTSSLVDLVASDGVLGSPPI